jgi:uncharacterized BrkB/YihY/UPF0761 family membrane protein
MCAPLVTNPIRAAWRLVGNIAHEYLMFDVPRRAAAIAYYAAASTAPMLVVVTADCSFVYWVRTRLASDFCSTQEQVSDRSREQDSPC